MSKQRLEIDLNLSSSYLVLKNLEINTIWSKRHFIPTSCMCKKTFNRL